MEILIVLTILVLAVAIGLALNEFLRQREQLNSLKKQEERRKRINVFIETAQKIQGAISEMRATIPSSELTATLSTANLAELQQIQGAIAQAEAEVALLKTTYQPQINAIAQQIGLSLPVPAQQQKPNNANPQAKTA